MKENHPSYRISWPLVGFVAVVAFYLIASHQAHLFGYLPFLFLLACPFFHMFGHRHNGRQRGQGHEH